MRYLYDQVAGNGKPRLVFALGEQEAIIIFGLLEKANKYMPKTPETQFDHARIKNMYEELRPLAKEINRTDFRYHENEPRPVKPGSLT